MEDLKRRVRLNPNYDCMDCGKPTIDEYMLKHEVWRSVVHTPGILCFYCIQKRLGRSLVIEDFMPNLPINRGIFLGYLIGITPINP